MHIKQSDQQHHCPICESTNITIFFELSGVPVHCNVLWPTKEAALQAPRGDIRLGFCGCCEYIFNLTFKPALIEYTQIYENSLHFSPRFQRYAESLAKHLIERYNLYARDIIEIGCGKGDFLELICSLGHNRGVGFDRSYVHDPGRQKTASPVTFVQDFFTEEAAKYPADIIISRHVLEHIFDPVDFLSMIRRAIGNRQHIVVFFEVPNVLFTLQDRGIWDIIFEHCAYFSPYSLASLFRRCGFVVKETAATFAGQFLTIEVTPNGYLTEGQPKSQNPVETIREDVNAFSTTYANRLELWRDEFRKMSGVSQKVVIWGTGSKGVTFLNALQTKDIVEFAVDINPRKHGKFIPGTGQEISTPDFLQVYQPDVVIVMNPVYRDEIGQMLAELNLAPEIVLA